MSLKQYLLAALCAVISGCVTHPSPNETGNGRYLQTYRNSTVMFEYDTVAAGHQDCQAQARFLMQQNPSMTVKCAHAPTHQPMPFYYKAHIQHTVAADHIKESSPYLVRLSSLAACRAAVASERRSPKTVILETNC